ncbi:MAG: capsular biosynthesis protein [Alphaproteobacteria bacterium]|nr:capsular biosynthesis protein [Alphaproteobacteria bacterium]
MSGGNRNKGGRTGGAKAVLILQGLATPFFATLGHKLADTGHTVHKIHFCGSDWLFRGARHPGITHHKFAGSETDLAAFYADLINRENITTILLLGDCRPVHQPAVMLAKEKGIALYAFDEGYIRPGWITMEIGGTNGFSHMPKDTDQLNTLAKEASAFSDRTAAIFKPAMMRRAWMDIAGHGANILFRHRFPHYRGHRPEPVWREAKGWIARAWRSLVHGRENDRVLSHVTLMHEPYFLVPLQLNSDYQIRLHSRFSGMPEFIEEVMASFAANAPADASLFFKNHPLDNGLINYRRLIRDHAKKLGLDERVYFAAGGDLGWFLDHAEGVVLTNSTVGFAAIRKGRPLKALGHAIYDLDGITDPQPLDSFWKNPAAPQQRLAEEFLTVVETYTQVRGDLFSAEGIECAAEEAVKVVTGTLPRLPAS